MKIYKKEIFMKTILFILLASTLGLQACSKDQSLDDYKQTRLNQNFAQLQAVQGRYSGIMTSKRTGKTLGALQLTLKATTQVQPSPDESKATAQPVLVANIDFQGASRISVVAQNSYFDPISGKYQANIPVQQTDASGQTKTENISITAAIQNGMISGTLEAAGYSDYGSTFLLNKDGRDIGSLAKESDIDPSTVFTQKNYLGTTVFADGTTKAVVMILLKPPTTSQIDFLSLLTPERPLQINLNYGNGAHIIFNNGTWDQRSGNLSGQTPLSRTLIPSDSTTTQTITLYLNPCQMSQDTTRINCSISTSSSQGPIAHLQLQASSSSNQEPPPDKNTHIEAVIRVYNGQAQLTPGAAWTPATMSVVDPAQTRMQEVTDLFFPPSEKILQVSITFPGVQLGISFPTTKWDINRQTLDANQTMVVDNQSNNLSLSCQNFTFSASKYSFTCTYLSSLRSTYVQFKFASK
jgi:hypothetical protein